MSWVDPYWREARYPGRCANCGCSFRKNVRILYVPRERRAYCQREPCGQRRWADFLARVGERAEHILRAAA